MREQNTRRWNCISESTPDRGTSGRGSQHWVEGPLFTARRRSAEAAQRRLGTDISDCRLSEASFQKQALALAEQLPPMRTAVWRHAEELGATPEVGDAVRLAVGEALTNIVMHAYIGRKPGPMKVQAWLDQEEHVAVRVLDEGRGLVPRLDSPGLGLGLGVMAQMADDFRIANREDRPGTIVSMRFSLT